MDTEPTSPEASESGATSASASPTAALAPVKVRVKALVDADQLKRDLSYSVADLSSAMADQASLFVHYGVLAAQAAKQVDSIKLALENAEARIYRLLRDEAAEKAVKLTEAQLEKGVASHQRVIAFKKALNEAKQVEAVAKIAIEAFRQRRDMLIQQGATERQEREGDLRIQRREAADADIRDRTMNMLRGAHS